MPDSQAFDALDADLLISPAEIEAGLLDMASRLQPIVDRGNCLLLGVLTGGMFPLVKLTEYLQGNFLIDYCHATRYAGDTEGAGISWQRHPVLPLEGLDVIIVDDIYDEGLTLVEVAAWCRDNGAASVQTAVLVIKDRERLATTPLPDFNTGLQVPDRYVFGCGMDVHNRWRHLPAIYALKDTGRT